jgi:mono/diheme cytochrome c family protein
VFINVALLLAGAIVAALYAWSGLYDVSAASGHNPVVAWALHATYEQSLHRHAKDIHVPPDLMSAENVRAGARLYSETCAVCHGTPGKALSPIGQGILPMAPTLLAATRRNNPQLMYWVIRNGVKMTAMPAFGKTQSDQAIWQAAAFLFDARGITPERYAALTSGGAGQQAAPKAAQ